MKYKVSLAGHFYQENDEALPIYREMGFTFEPNTTSIHAKFYHPGDDEVTIELNSIDELQALIDKVGTLIVAKDRITIYNDYVE